LRGSPRSLAAQKTLARDDNIPCLPAGRLQMMRTGYCRAPGGGSGNGHRTQNRLPASGDRLPDLLEAVSFKVSGAGLTDLEAQAPEPFCLRREPSHLWLGTGRIFYLYCLRIPSHSREAEFSCLDLQSYSRRLCLSSGKHYRLYP
jgi:hypothetical protein